MQDNGMCLFLQADVPSIPFQSEYRCISKKYMNWKNYKFANINKHPVKIQNSL